MMGLLPFVLAFMLGLVLFLPLRKVLFGSREPPNLPNGTMGFPLVGETLGYLKPHKSTSLGSFLERHCSRYGKVFKSHLFGCRTVVSCDHELNVFVLQNEGKLFQSSYPGSVVGILGKNSILLVTGDLHKKLRGLAVGFGSASRSKPDFFQFVDKLARLLVESWRGKPQIRFYKEAKRFTMDVMLKYVFDMESQDPLAPKILEDFLTFMEGFVSIPVPIPGMSFHKATKARARLTSTVKQIIREREKREKFEKGDFLDEIMQRENLCEEEKVSVALDILLAGYETTSGLLALLVYFVAQAPPSVLQRLKEEHQALRIRKKEDESLSMEDVKQMEFTATVISETLRCGNLVKFVHRKALQDVKFKGYVIPAGWKVLPVLAASNLDPSLHQRPSEFNPSRWTDQTTSKKIVSFGGGARLCPGVDFAKVEASFFLHHLVLNYRWKTQGEEYPISRPYLDFNKGLVVDMEPTE
ncbi:hypothetical protein NMG60_11006740 [Bertholletia excelsa]